MYRHILFDFDGTLADSSHCAVVATQSAFIEFGFKVPDASAIIALMGVPIERSFMMLAGDGIIHQDNCEAVFARFRELYKVHAETSLQLFGGIFEMLTGLESADRQCAVVSSKKHAVLQQNCEQLGIARFFKQFIGSDSVSNYKPHPEPVFRALADLGADDASAAIMIGDSTFDIEMGRKAGIDTCAVTWGAHSDELLQTAVPTHMSKDAAALAAILLSDVGGNS